MGEHPKHQQSSKICHTLEYRVQHCNTNTSHVNEYLDKLESSRSKVRNTMHTQACTQHAYKYDYLRTCTHVDQSRFALTTIQMEVELKFPKMATNSCGVGLSRQLAFIALGKTTNTIQQRTTRTQPWQLQGTVSYFSCKPSLLAIRKTAPTQERQKGGSSKSTEIKRELFLRTDRHGREGWR